MSVTRSDALGVALPATRFAWQDAAPGIFAAPVSFDSAQANAGGQLIPIDVNGDGCVDFLYACAGPQRQLQLTLFMAQPGQFALSSPITIPVTDLLFGGSLLPMDVNGDGCVDLVYAVDDNGALGLTLFLANRQPDGSWTLVQGPANGAGPSGVVFGSQLLSLDIDGDGRVDLVSTSNSRGMLELLSLLSTDSGFVLGTSMTTGLSYGGQCLAMDVNGDGMTDLVYAHESDGALALAVFLATVDGSGAGFSAPISELASTSGLPATGTLIPLDINGDGLIDLAYAHSSDNDESFTITTLLSTGTSFVNASSISPTTGANTPLPWTGTLLPMDVNGDGQIDLVVVSGNGDQVEVTVLLSQGSGFAQVESVNQFSTSTSWGGSCLPIDLAGRGLTDLLYVSAANNQLSLCALPASGPFSDLLIGITNGLGGTYSIRYAPLTDPSVYTRGSVATAQQIDPQGVLQSGVSGATYAPPSTSSSNFGASTAGSTLSTQLADFPKYIVQSYVESDGRGGDYSYSHAYASALLDLTGRGWLGFATVARTDPQAQTTCLSTYNQLFPLTGTTASRATSRSTDAAAMSCTSFTYAAVASQYSPASGPISTVEVVQKSQQTVQVYTFGTLDDTYVTEYAHDSYGNIVLTSILGDGSVPPLYDIESYQNNVSATTWQIGFRTSLIRANDPRGDDCLTKEAWTYASGTMNVATRQRVVDPGAASPT
ncbi:MAG TPA: FG-GAP-like repeat-containing protein, partial [Enhygromyxa sp.]|nr:FG-GAP-like repeat-containing protein [Enhygromyxa sp.]